MWLSLVALFLPAEPAPAGAEALFKRMEQPVLKCKTFRCDLKIVLEPGKDNTVKGRLLVARGNKLRLELDGSIMGKSGKAAFVSDGTKMLMTGMGPGKPQQANKHLTEIVLASVSRAGIVLPLFFAAEVKKAGEKPKPFNLEKDYTVSGFKLGKKEMVAGVMAQAIDYKIRMRGGKDQVDITVWVDAKTHLPVKRLVRLKRDTENLTVTETYTKAALDEKIDGKEFTLPKSE